MEDTNIAERFIEDLKAIKEERYRNIISEIVIQKKIPTHYPKGLLSNSLGGVAFQDIGAAMRFREVYNKYCSWPLISTGWVNRLADYIGDKKCIEIMAGNGLLTYALRDRGINIIATDDGSWLQRHKYTIIENKDAVTAVKEAKDIDFVICSWPPCGDTEICRVVKEMYHKHPNAKLIYIGEEQNGCNACEDFFNIVDMINDPGIDRINALFSQFFGIHDWVYLMRPNNKAKKWRRKKHGKYQYE